MSSNPVRDFRAHAEFHARESPTGIGAAVVESSVEAGGHVWGCIVTDLPPFRNISSEQVKEGIERFAATLQARDWGRHLLNANRLHIDGTAR